MTPRDCLHQLNIAQDQLNQAERMFLISMNWESQFEESGLKWRDSPQRTWLSQGLAITLAKATLADSEVEHSHEQDTSAEDS